MNDELVDNADTIVVKADKNPLHLRIVSVGAFILFTFVILFLMDMLITSIANNIAISHARLGEEITDGPIPLIVNMIRGYALGAFALSVVIGFFGKKIYLHAPGRVLQRFLMIMLCIMSYVIFGLGFGLLLSFFIFFWDPKKLVNWSEHDMKLYRGGVGGTLLFLVISDMVRMGLVTFMIISLTTLVIVIFGVFFWTPEFSTEWPERKLVIYRVGSIALIAIYSVVAIFTASGDFGAYPMPQFLSVTISSLLPPVLGPIASIIPWLLLVIPLYLFLPKIIRDVWNLRPSIESFWQEFIYHPLGILGVIIIGAIVIIALLAPWIAPYYWTNELGADINLEDLLQRPSADHILGTNQNGEDIFSRVIYGSQISLLIGFAASIVAVFLGTAVGLISGYYGGIADMILMRITDVFLCLPTLPLMLIFLVIFGQGLQNVIFVIAILGWTGTARMVRSEALSLRERPLTEAAHALGASDSYILIHHILPNTLPLILANMILGVVTAILSEAGIAFLGFVNIHGQPSWGIILHWAWKNAALLANKWWWFIPPGVLIMLTTLGFVFISHTADKVVNPRLRGRR